jgi:hypothetical protein
MGFIIVKLQGGLGNQMFQYAFGLSLSKKLKCTLYLDLSFFRQYSNDLTPRNYELTLFPGQINIASDKLVNRFLHSGPIRRLINKVGISRTAVYRENTLRINKQVFNIKPSVYLEGFWQSEQYFNDYEDLVRRSLCFKKTLNHESQKIADELANQADTISIHVRRGDYVSSKRTNELHGICSIKYYTESIKLISNRLNNPHFYFFSDDPGWVKENLLQAVKNASLIEHNMGNESWQDMALMSKCKHHIIANSSFSWWGAWLNPDKEKMVIAPKSWFSSKTDYFDDKDIVPENWIRLPNE